MSPEEASGALPSEASDWYGVGVTLYEALTGTVPFDGLVPDVLLRKATSDPHAVHREIRSRRISAPSAWDCCIAVPSSG